MSIRIIVGYRADDDFASGAGVGARYMLLCTSLAEDRDFFTMNIFNRV